MRAAGPLLAAALAVSGCVADRGPRVAAAPEVESGVALPFGSLGRVCGAVPGRPVAQAPRQGRAVWRLYDSAPGTSQARPQYITGFADGCAREVTGALVLFGTPALHEAARYDAALGTPYSTTDTAYEVIKAQVCGVGSGEPCPPGRIGRLERRLTFVTVYPHFGSGLERMELLLDDGAVAAQAVVR